MQKQTTTIEQWKASEQNMRIDMADMRQQIRGWKREMTKEH